MNAAPEVEMAARREFSAKFGCHVGTLENIAKNLSEIIGETVDPTELKQGQIGKIRKICGRFAYFPG